ncbi:MAG: polysaccharide biosynthesis/export family protein [Chthoniobacteraceae bacterium]
MRSLILALTVLLAFTESGWSQLGRRGRDVAEPRAAAAVPRATPADPSSNQSAVLRVNDSFEMQLGGVPPEYAVEFRLQYTVGDDGNVQVPLIGSMRAAGLSISRFSDSVAEKLRNDKIFKFPTVAVNLVPQSRFVTVGGAVRAPQAVPWSQDLTLSAAIMRAGGPTEFGNMKRVRVSRNGQVAVFNVREAEKDPNQNPKLLPSDEVVVSE